MSYRKLRRVESREFWDADARAADHRDPCSLLIAAEEAVAEAEADAEPDRGREFRRWLAYWIGPLDPCRSLRVTAQVVGMTPPSDPLEWIAAGAQRATGARIHAQLRLIHQRHAVPVPRADYLPDIATATVEWLLDGRSRADHRALLSVTRGAYCLATRVAPELVAGQSLGGLAVLWNVSRQALCNQCRVVFDGTGIGGDYLPLERHWRSTSAQGNHSIQRSRAPRKKHLKK